MNRNQKIAVVVGATAVLLMLIFPPFHVQIRDTAFNCVAIVFAVLVLLSLLNAVGNQPSG